LLLVEPPTQLTNNNNELTGGRHFSYILQHSRTWFSSSAACSVINPAAALPLAPSSLGWFSCALPLDDRQDIVFSEDEVFFSIEHDVTPGIFAEKNPISQLNIGGKQVTVFQQFSFTDSDHYALLGFLPGGIGNDQPGFSLFLCRETLYQNTIA
jgi:hypothetical protein